VSNFIKSILISNSSIALILRKLTELFKIDSNDLKVRRSIEQLNVQENAFEEYLQSLTDVSTAVNLSFVKQEFTLSELKTVLKNLSFPIVLFAYKNDEIIPIIFNEENNGLKAWFVQSSQTVEILPIEVESWITSLLSYEECCVIQAGNKTNITQDENRFLFSLCPVALNSMFGADIDNQMRGEVNHYTPLKRFWKFVKTEKINIYYIYVYSFVIGIINLTLPLGIQAIIGRISGGLLFDGVIVLITFVIIGIIIAGGLQIMQIYLVEILQRRIFARAAFEFAFRIPRIKTEALLKSHPPELMNRFFDVITLQKGFSKILLDLTTAALQIIFGLLLLSFYNISFVFFGIFLFVLLLIVFTITGKKGLQSSIYESKYKYKIVAWFEELARNNYTFKSAGFTNMPLDKTDDYVDEYLGARKSHFSVLLTQYLNITVFKILVTGGTLIIGCLLVVNREISLGQFVASEIVIIFIVGAIEKIILNLDTVYDVLTALDKIGHVTDLPLDAPQGIRISTLLDEEGFELETKNLSYSYPEKKEKILNGINLKIKKGEKVCITGTNGSGKNTFTHIISGLLNNYDGVATVNGISLKNIHLTDLHDAVAINTSQDEIFEGTIEENVRLGKPGISQIQVVKALESAGLIDFVNSLKNGIYTKLLPTGKGISGSAVRKIILARCIIKKPKLFIFNDFFDKLEKSEKAAIVKNICSKESNTTLIAVSTDPFLMKECDRIIIFHSGKIVAEGTFDFLSQQSEYKGLLSQNE